jgi:hypothetical protein
MARTARIALIAASLGAITLFGIGTGIAQPPRLDWSELIPLQQKNREVMRGRIAHGLNIPMNPNAPAPEVLLRDDLDGREVTMVGYVVPLRFEGDKMMEFMLAPYMGACIHVPPPPANQLVYVNSKEGLDEEAFFGTVTVTGKIRVSRMSNDLADSGYAIEDPVVVSDE